MDTIPGNDPMENPPQPPLAGLDPADLLKQGAAEDTLLDGAAFSFQPPAVDELAALFPQFEILELVGKGGMGAVYKVRQKELDRIVALKILPPAIGESPGFAARFTREAKALAKLNHPGIVTLHEFGQQDGLYFILMEYVDGVNLAQLIRSGRISPREALAIVPQICDALQFAHDQGIVHRDIKPENILLDRLGRVKVADFGIAKVVAACDDPMRSGDTPVPTDATIAGKIIGTPQYMAPEQIDHPADVDHRADIYALGVVFYQMLTGELPGKELQAPSRKVHIDVRLDEIVMQAMEKNPELRYQQASVFKTRVETVAENPRESSRMESSALIKADRARLTFEESSGLPVSYPSMGEVALRGDRLVVSQGPNQRVISLSNIQSLGEAVMPAWYSPAGHRFCAVDFEEDGNRRRLAFLPGSSLFRLVESTRQQADWWNSAIQREVKSSTGRYVPVSPFPVRLSMSSMWAYLWPLLILIFLPLCFKRIVDASTGSNEFEVLSGMMPFLIPALMLVGVLAWRAKSLHGAGVRAATPGDTTVGSKVIFMAVFGTMGFVAMWMFFLRTRPPVASNPQPPPPVEAAPPVVSSVDSGWMQQTNVSYRKLSWLLDKQPALAEAGAAPEEGPLFPLKTDAIGWSESDGQFNPVMYLVKPFPRGASENCVEGRNRSGEPTRLDIYRGTNPLASANRFLGSYEVACSTGGGDIVAGFRLSESGQLYFEVWTEKENVTVTSRHLRAGDPLDKPSGGIRKTKSMPVDANMAEVEPVQNTPKPEAKAPSPDQVSIAIQADGAVAVGDVPISSPALMDELKKAARKNKDVVVVIRSAPEVPYAKVVEIIDLCQKSGFWNLSFATAGKANPDSVSLWLAKMDEGNYFGAYSASAEVARKTATERQWTDAMTLFRKPLGGVVSRRMIRSEEVKTLPGLPDGEHRVIQFNTEFANKKDAVETVIFTKESDGVSRAAGYFIK